MESPINKILIDENESQNNIIMMNTIKTYTEEPIMNDTHTHR